jgi:hypothetical protein
VFIGEQLLDPQCCSGISADMKYVYENEDPSQCLKMLSEKLDINGHIESNSLIFPSQHIKEVFNDKNISIFFINDYIVPLQRYEKRVFGNEQFL